MFVCCVCVFVCVDFVVLCVCVCVLCTWKCMCVFVGVLCVYVYMYILCVRECTSIIGLGVPFRHVVKGKLLVVTVG